MRILQFIIELSVRNMFELYSQHLLTNLMKFGTTDS